MLIDTHCHLDFEPLSENVSVVIARAKTMGVERIITVGTSEEASRKGIEIADKHEGIYATVGIHPEEIYNPPVGGQFLNTNFKNLIKSSKKIVAIGECGLDYHGEYGQTEEERKQQKIIFKEQIELAEEVSLPLIIHCREAWKDTLEILKNYNLTGVFHCFSGDEMILKKVLEWGFYVGFDGNITYKKATELRKIARFIPLERVLLETDSPFLTPEPMRGEPNYPENVKIVAQWIADIKSLSLEEVERITTENSKKLFNF